MLRFRLRTLFVLTTIGAFATYWIVDTSDVRNNPFLLSKITTTVKTDSNGNAYSDYLLYSEGNYGILEFGNLRIAVRGEPFKDSDTGDLVLLTGHKNVTRRHSIGRGIKFLKTIDSNGTHFEFVGLTFKVVDGKLDLLGNTIQVDGPPKLVLIRNGRAKIFTSLQR